MHRRVPEHFRKRYQITSGIISLRACVRGERENGFIMLELQKGGFLAGFLYLLSGI